jgi:hypothetical protein
MHRMLLVAAVLAAVSLAGCCRMCCWQNGGKWSGGGCCLPQPVAQPVIGAPVVGAPVVLPQQQTYAPAGAVPATSYLPTTPCTCN